MADLKQFNLTQLKQLIENNDEHLANNYISQNLAVARNIRVGLVKDQFLDSPTVLPEMRLLLVKQGWARTTLNLVERNITAGDLVFLGSNGIIQYQEASPDIQAVGFSCSDDLFQLAIGQVVPKAFDGHLRDFHLHLEQDQADYYDQLHLLLNRHIMQAGHSSQVTLHLMGALLCYAGHLWQQHQQSHLESQSREQRLFTDFIQLVTQHAPEQHAIDFYASRLCLTPRYLSTVIKQVSGKSAKQWIDDALVTRIKIDLMHTDKPVATIGDEMNFPNPSFFTKFFKRMTGLTPREYQNRHKN